MQINCEIDSLWTLKNGGKLVFKMDSYSFDKASEHYGNFRKKPLIMTMTNEDGEALTTECEINNLRAIKKGGTLTIALADGVIDMVTKEYKKFRDVPLTMDLKIDADKYREIMNQISDDQRKKIYAILGDIAKHICDDVESVKTHQMKPAFLQVYTQYSDFSLSNCSKELAGDFITFLIMFCFTQGIPLKDHPRKLMDNDEAYLYLCLKLKICAICGKPAEVHHWDAIGAGRDRRHYNDSDHRKIALCRVHHSEVEQIGRDTFKKKYHVTGIKVA